MVWLYKNWRKQTCVHATKMRPDTAAATFDYTLTSEGLIYQ